MEITYFIYTMTTRNKSSLEPKVPMTTTRIAEMNYYTSVQLASATCKPMEPATFYF